jgi:hypothetical protein
MHREDTSCGCDLLAYSVCTDLASSGRSLRTSLTIVSCGAPLSTI